MKKNVDNATIEELLADITHYEDVDSALIISSATGDGGAFVMSFEGNYSTTAPTLKEALIQFQIKVLGAHKWILDDDDELMSLDWKEKYYGQGIDS